MSDKTNAEQPTLNNDPEKKKVVVVKPKVVKKKVVVHSRPTETKESPPQEKAPQVHAPETQEKEAVVQALRPESKTIRPSPREPNPFGPPGGQESGPRPIRPSPRENYQRPEYGRPPQQGTTGDSRYPPRDRGAPPKQGAYRPGPGGPRPAGDSGHPNRYPPRQGDSGPASFNRANPGAYNRSGPPSGPGGYNRSGPGAGGGYNRSGPPSGPGGYNRSGPPSGPGSRPYGPRPPRPNGPAPTAPGADQPKKFRSKKNKSVDKERALTKEKYEEKERVEKLSHFRRQQAQKANPIPKEIEILEVITVAELARKMNLKVTDLITKLMKMGLMVSINQQIDHETAAILAAEFGTEVRVISLYDETLIESDVENPDRVVHRPPIVTIMGHVDHGKTKLLDAIRSANVAGGEHGGITQHIGAYQVRHAKGSITFLDTPGHEAFSMMRARGAQITDIVVLVVAANDGVMPQTVEAIRHAQDAKVPIIVAINKIDLPDSNVDRIKQQLAEFNLSPEDWGGSTLYVEISALKRTGLDTLIDVILLQAEVMELTADPGRRAEGKVLESRIDQGRGTISTVLIEHGTLKIGDPFVGGIFPGRVRAMFNDLGQAITEAGPSTPVEIMGCEGIPNAGDPFQVTDSDKEAHEYADKRQELKRQEEGKNVKKITLSNLYDTIHDGNIQELKVIIKGDTHGSVEALKGALTKLSTSEIRLNVLHSAAGPIVRDDVYLAAASQAIIIGFHVRPSTEAQQAADQEKVEIRKYNIIYDAVEDIRTAMEGLLAPDLKEEATGTAEVRETYKVPKIGLIAGCHITRGKVKKTSQVHVVRDGIQIHTGKLSSLRRFKDDAKEVAEGYDCGIGIEDFQDIQNGDIIEAFDVIKIAKKLEKSAP